MDTWLTTLLKHGIGDITTMYTPQNWMKNKHIQQCWGILGPLAPAMKKTQLTTLYHVIILYPDETSLLSPHIPSSLIG